MLGKPTSVMVTLITSAFLSLHDNWMTTVQNPQDTKEMAVTLPIIACVKKNLLMALNWTAFMKRMSNM